MSLEGKYNQVLLEELLVNNLKANDAVPNLDLLTNKLDEMKQALPLLGTRPLVSLRYQSSEATLDWPVPQNVPHFDYFENASATKWNSILLNQHRDLKVMYDLTEEFTDRLIAQTMRWVSHYENPWMEEPGRLQSMGSLRV